MDQNSESAPHPTPLVLGIESSCDDTACAVLDGDGRVLSSVVSSQLAAHLEYGGVVPEIASREHLRNWPAVSARALKEAGIELASVDAVAATRGPGLVGSLLVGLSVGKAIAYGLEVPFFGVHHLEGHLYSPFLVPPDPDECTKPTVAADVPQRFTGLVVSGGHTALYEVEAHSEGAQGEQGAEFLGAASASSETPSSEAAHTRDTPDSVTTRNSVTARDRVITIAETRDDAMGECFDKVGKRLGLPFPGGPIVDRLAELGVLDRGRAQLKGRAAASSKENRTLFFRTGRCGDTLDFSYSGLKTQAIVEIERLERGGLVVDPEELLSLADRASDVAGLGALGTDVAESSQYDAVQLLAAFRDAAVRQILDRVERYHRAAGGGVKHLAVSGGVAANRALRRALVAWGERQGVTVHLVPLAFCGDNAAMIAHAALRRLRHGEQGDPLAVDAKSRLAVG